MTRADGVAGDHAERGDDLVLGKLVWVVIFMRQLLRHSLVDVVRIVIVFPQQALAQHLDEQRADADEDRSVPAGRRGTLQRPRPPRRRGTAAPTGPDRPADGRIRNHPLLSLPLHGGADCRRLWTGHGHGARGTGTGHGARAWSALSTEPGHGVRESCCVGPDGSDAFLPRASRERQPGSGVIASRT